MLTRIEVTNASGDTLVLPLTNESTGYIVENVDGLGPVKASVASSKFANIDGAQYQSSKRDVRNIVLRLSVDPDYYNQTVQTLRQALYAFFIPKSYVRLRFHIGTGLDYDIAGYVESMETTVFSKDPSFDISVLCMNPDFTDSDELTFTGSSTNGLDEIDFTYTGTTPTGILFTFLPDRSVTDFVIYMRSPDGTLTSMSYGTALEDEDQLIINTVVGQKAVTLIRDSVETPMLQAISSTSGWVQLIPGVNHIRVYAPGATVPYTIVYRNSYGGL